MWMVRLIKCNGTFLHLWNCEKFWRRLDLVMKRESVMLIFLVQVFGTFFYFVLSAAYFLPFPSTEVLIGEPLFKSLLLAFGALFFVSILVSMIVYKIRKKT
jgi:uncharacterized membrane protein (DUF485 family)